MESTIIQNVQGVVNLAPQVKELLALINRFGGQEAAALQSSVYELEDTAALPAARSAAKRRLKQFLGQLAGTLHDVGVDLLEKYLESKAGLYTGELSDAGVSRHERGGAQVDWPRSTLGSFTARART